MINRTIVITQPAVLKKKMNQLEITIEDNGEVKKVPIEDIGILLLESPQILVSNAVLQHCMHHRVAVVCCDANHLPQGYLLPIDGHTLMQAYVKAQIEASTPLKKQLWTQTVSAKIYNQAQVLKKLNIPVKNMEYWAKNVLPGDAKNFEGQAAAYYWKHIFEHITQDFKRDPEVGIINAYLNYGCAIVRALTARSLVLAGLWNMLGIYHRNQYNAYCLADDIMEPYRPYVDDWVLDMIAEDEELLSRTEITPKAKRKLLEICVRDVEMNKKTSPLLIGNQRTCTSLAKCFRGERRKIIYPKLIA